MDCPQCQSPNSADSAFWTACGTRLAAPAGAFQPAGAGPVFQLDLRRLTRVDQIVAGASLIAMISIWLPWCSVSWGSGIFESSGSASFRGTGLHGWLWLAAAAPVMVPVARSYLESRNSSTGPRGY